MFLVLIMLCLITFLLIWYFVAYPLLMSIFALKMNNNLDSYFPSVSIIIPTYNEEKDIENRIKNIVNLNYSKENYEIIIVDSGSTDRTISIVENLINKYQFLRLIKEDKRNGKASAINLGKKNAKYDIILVSDANAIFHKDVLKNIMPHFKDPKVGAVGGRYCVSNPENSITQSESFYWDLEVIMRMGESFIDSACLFHGEINAWRKEIVDADVNALSEDLDMCIQIMKKGYKIQYEPKAMVYEPSATTSKDQIKQRKRTSVGTIQVMFKHWKYLLLPKSIYSLFIFPSHKILAIISPFLLIGILLCYILIWNVNIILVHLVPSLIVFGILLVLLMNLKSKILLQIDKIQNSNNISLKNIPRIINYVLLNEYLILLAWKSYLFKDYSVLWEKVESSRLDQRIK